MKLEDGLRRFPTLFVTGVLLVASCVGRVSSSKAPAPGSPGATTGGGTGGGVGTGSAAGNGNVTIGGGTGGVAPLPPKDPGRVTMRQLNRGEYNNTVRDLLGTTLQPATNFLNDAPDFGFDNNADYLSVSPTQAGLYQQAAELLAAEAITPAKRATLVTCDLTVAGDTCARSLITAFGARAYRRPLIAAEITSYLALMSSARTAGATADESWRTALEAFLVSPHFLFRVEIDPDPVSLVAHPVGAYEMASRLSYLVYRSMPDKPLFDAAAAGKLSAQADLQTQLTRMLADPKGSTFSQQFATQWLGTGSLETAQFDTKVFPSFTPALAASMKQEVISFFDDFLREDLPVTQLLTANFSFFDDNLATLYGVPAVGAGGNTKKTTFNTPQRGGGFLTMAGPLAVTSHPSRTSLVRRGAWVLSQLLCSEPPPPPPNIPPLATGTLMGTQREILAMHRKDPSCGACHNIMDNLGLALENYDALGAWRTTENGEVIDASGMLPGGPSFKGGPAMAAVISADPRFAPCVSRKMLTYALGRTLLPGDEGYVVDISAAKQGAAPGVREVLSRLVVSEPFTMRHGEAAAPGGMMP